ncbi:UDP-N-acetylmuramate--L-alanine ligase, partial [bacterium]|nr:UDP-N-acetylmuramate--L-alanine ligase [bacterium]
MRKRRVYFLGIGGISMSALAKYELWQNAEVFGSDLKENEQTKALKRKGAKVFIGHSPEH